MPRNLKQAAEKQASTSREILGQESRCTRLGTEAKADLAEEKAEFISGAQEKVLRSPFRASVRGWRSSAAP